jgi:hypothetical protein
MESFMEEKHEKRLQGSPHTKEEEGHMMRRFLCLAVACMLALLVVSVSNVSAIGLSKIENTEWLVSTTWIWYTPEGYYDGAAAGGDAIMYIGTPESGAGMAWESMVNSFEGWGAGLQGQLTLDAFTYNATTNILKSTSGSAAWPLGDGFYAYQGPLTGKITFSSTKAFTGTVTIVHEDGSSLVISLSGKKLGQFPAPLATHGLKFR